MVCITYVALPVARFVSVKVVEGLIAMFGHWADVAVAGIVAVVDVAVEPVTP
jgi:hypothetical protein